VPDLNIQNKTKKRKRYIKNRIQINTNHPTLTFVITDHAISSHLSLIDWIFQKLDYDDKNQMKQAKIRPILKSLHNLQHDEGGNYMVIHYIKNRIQINTNHPTLTFVITDHAISSHLSLIDWIVLFLFLAKKKNFNVTLVNCHQSEMEWDINLLISFVSLCKHLPLRPLSLTWWIVTRGFDLIRDGRSKYWRYRYVTFTPDSFALCPYVLFLNIF
jgi:hypothetical protein